MADISLDFEKARAAARESQSAGDDVKSSVVAMMRLSACWLDRLSRPHWVLFAGGCAPWWRKQLLEQRKMETG